MSTANEQPGSGLPEEPGETGDAAIEGAQAGPGGAGGQEPVGAEPAGGPEAVGAESAAGAESAGAESVDVTETAVVAEAAEDAAEGDGAAAETEEERLAREQIEFDKLVAAFHSESAPDPQAPRRTGPGGPAGTGTGTGSTGPHKIIRYPVLDPRPEWEGGIVEPTDETTSDPLDYIEHYEPPDPELPQASAATLASWTMLVGGVAFLVLHTLLGWQTPEYLGWLAIIGVFGGIITLVARMKPDRDEYDDPDNGAVV